MVESHRLTNGLLFGLPVVLDTDDEALAVGDRVLLTYNGEVRRGGWWRGGGSGEGWRGAGGTGGGGAE